MAGDPRSYAVYKAVAEMPASLRNRVVKTMEHEMSFEELRKELEKVASLKVMEEAVGKPKVTKITETAASGQQGQAGGARRLQPILVRLPPLWGEDRAAPRGPELCSGEEGLGVHFLWHQGLPRGSSVLQEVGSGGEAGVQAATRDEEPESSWRTVPNPRAQASS